MSITHNGKEYGATKVINYSAAPDYNRGVTVDNIQSGNYQATDNGFLFIQLQSQQSNPTKVSVIRSKTPITDTGTEIASIVLSQYQYSETLTAQVMAREYYKLVIEGAGNPQVLSCMFYPYASTVPMKLTENITVEQVEGLENELAGKQDAGDYATNTALNNGLAGKQNKGDYATSNELTQGLAGKQDKGNYFNKNTDILDIAHGGHGTTDGFGWKNAYSDAEFNAKIGLKYPFTTQQLASAIIKLIQPVFCMVYGWRQDQSFITDFPGSIFSHRTIINYIDNSQFYIETIDPGSLTTYICNVSGGVAGKWIKTRNYDGSIPADLIPPTVLKYENSDGVWTETKLTTGEVMLEGYIKNNSGDNISLPKTVNVDNTYVKISYNGGIFSMSGNFPSYTVESNRIIIYMNDNNIDSLNISIVAFLA